MLYIEFIVVDDNGFTGGFASREEAEQFAAENGGKVVDFSREY